MYAKIAKRHDRKRIGEHFHYKTIHKRSFVKNLNKLMANIQKSKTIDKKISAFVVMFEFIVHNRWYLKMTPNFETIVHDKLFEMCEHPKFLDHSIRYLCKLH